MGEQVSSLPRAPTARVCSILGTARRASRGAGKLETKERIIRALAQHRVPAGKSSFPYQDP